MPEPPRRRDWRELSLWSDEKLHDLSAQPGLLERRGVHPMREKAVQWVRENPDDARKLPGWDPRLLSSILRGEDLRAEARAKLRTLTNPE